VADTGADVQPAALSSDLKKEMQRHQVRNDHEECERGADRQIDHVENAVEHCDDDQEWNGHLTTKQLIIKIERTLRNSS